ncbi:coiled-coil domain-containing protein 42 like-2 [Poeciliopsis prolifica]|uniref:coiled-coil domain-containing protein 42 like-2 n=1 Tax=Poeciliopsis prolifica TaxID=188132 RepID=UPI00241333E3|nr:coiled-coil domain-containing protein 42 like-2 [Poeciliopsis prolifica]
MTTTPGPVLDEDSSPKLQMEKRVKNVFVTQPEDPRDRKKEKMRITAATETSSKLLEAGVKALKRTLIARKQAELHELDVQLALKTQDFRSCMEALANRRSELETQQRQTKEEEMKFEKFLAEKEVKRLRVLKQSEATLEQNILKQRRIEDLTKQLTKLETRKHILKQRTEKNKIYEDYLMKTLDRLPSLPRHNSSESLVMSIIRRHETLSVTHQELLQRLRRMEAEVDQQWRQLQNMKQQHSIATLMSSKELSELHSELESLKEKNRQVEVNLMMKRGVSREKVEEVGKLLLAVNNLAQECYIPEFGLLEGMSVLTMMDMVKEFVLDQADTERRVRKLESCSTAALTDKRWRESLKSFGSKTQIKSSSKASKISDSSN